MSKLWSTIAAKSAPDSKYVSLFYPLPTHATTLHRVTLRSLLFYPLLSLSRPVPLRNSGSPGTLPRSPSSGLLLPAWTWDRPHATAAANGDVLLSSAGAVASPHPLRTDLCFALISSTNTVLLGCPKTRAILWPACAATSSRKWVTLYDAFKARLSSPSAP